MAYVLGILLLILIAGLIMVGTDLLYTVAGIIVPFLAVFMVAVGILTGFFVAVKNTFTVYRDIYFRRGRK